MGGNCRNGRILLCIYAIARWTFCWERPRYTVALEAVPKVFRLVGDEPETLEQYPAFSAFPPDPRPRLLAACATNADRTTSNDHVENLTKTFRVAERPAERARRRSPASVRRRYRIVEALKGISFSLGEGELLGLIGPNGAGKSTTIKILCGILEPTAGSLRGRWASCRGASASATSLALAPCSVSARSCGGISPSSRASSCCATSTASHPIAIDKTSDELIALLDLERLLATPVRQLSLGQRMRCEIAASMLHEPRVLFLDEPTIGLDAVAKLAVRDFVKTLNRERGVTVILTTHDMHDIEALAERVIVIGKGVILADGTLASLRRGALAERRLSGAVRGDVESLGRPLGQR